MNPDTLAKTLRIIAENTNVADHLVTPDRTLASLGIDSLDTLEIIMSIEDEFDMSIDEGQANFTELTTVNDVAIFVQAQIDAAEEWSSTRTSPTYPPLNVSN